MLCCLSVAACATTEQADQREKVPVEERSSSVEKQDTQGQITVDEIQSAETEFTPIPEPDTVKQDRETILDDKQPMNPAVVALLEDVHQYENTGKADQAAATIERALRIEPKNPLLWQRLSALRMRQGHWQQAIAMAQKSNALAAGDTQLQLTNWKIIAQASEAQGDHSGLLQAQKMIRSLSN